MPKINWDAFAGGVAEGGVPGFRSGIDLGRANEAARADRLRALLLNPEPAIQEGERRANMLGPANFGSFADAEKGGGAAVDVGTEAAGLGIGGAFDLPQNQNLPSPARGFAQNADTRKLLESLSDEDIKYAKDVKAQQDREVKAKDIENAMNKLILTSSILDKLAAQYKDLGVMAQQKETAGDAVGAMVLKEKAARIRAMLQAGENDSNIAVSALMGQGVEQADIDHLRDSPEKNVIKDILIRKYTGQPRTRPAGGTRIK